jgi:hypothetical protein
MWRGGGSHVLRGARVLLKVCKGERRKRHARVLCGQPKTGGTVAPSCPPLRTPNGWSALCLVSASSCGLVASRRPKGVE